MMFPPPLMGEGEGGGEKELEGISWKRSITHFLIRRF